MKPKIQSDV